MLTWIGRRDTKILKFVVKFVNQKLITDCTSILLGVQIFLANKCYKFIMHYAETSISVFGLKNYDS